MILLASLILPWTESWLNKNVASAELFPPTYDVYPKDCSDGYGGVLIAIKKVFIAEQISYNGSCEDTFIKLPLDGKKTLIIGSAYRPPSSSSEYMDDLCSAITDIHRRHRNAVFWLGGDFNLPDVNWETYGKPLNPSCNLQVLSGYAGHVWSATNGHVPHKIVKDSRPFPFQSPISCEPMFATAWNW